VAAIVAMVGGSYIDPWESIWLELMILSGGPPGVWNPECHEAYMSTIVYHRGVWLLDNSTPARRRRGFCLGKSMP
jgi:hypothetical protein